MGEGFKGGERQSRRGGEGTMDQKAAKGGWEIEAEGGSTINHGARGV